MSTIALLHRYIRRCVRGYQRGDLTRVEFRAVLNVIAAEFFDVPLIIVAHAIEIELMHAEPRIPCVRIRTIIRLL